MLTNFFAIRASWTAPVSYSDSENLAAPVKAAEAMSAKPVNDFMVFDLGIESRRNESKDTRVPPLYLSAQTKL